MSSIKSNGELQSSHNLIHHIFNSIPDEILVLDSEMVVQEANDSFLRKNALDIEQIRGRHCHDVDQGVRGTCKVEVEDCPFYTVMERKVTVSEIRKYVDKDNNVRYAAIVGAPLLDDKGEVVGMLEMTRDVTDRIRLEEDLKATEVRLHQFMEMSPIPTYVKDRKGRYMEVNPAACQLFGRKKADIIGKTDSEILPRQAAKIMNAGNRDVLNTGREVSFDSELKMDEKSVFLNTVKYPILDIEGQVSALCGLSADVTAQKEAETELTRTREYLENILEHSSVMIITADLDGKVVSFNRYAEKSLGYTSEEVIGKQASMFYLRDGVGERRSAMARVETDGNVEDFETVAVRKDGTEIPVVVHISLLKDSSQNTIGTVGICKDISQRKMLMEQVMQSERQAAVGRLAAGVAHEINNPLAMINEIAGYLDDLVSGGPGSDNADLMEELKEGLPKILSSVNMGRSITHRLLSFARKKEALVNETDVNTAIEEMIPFLEKESRLAQVTVHLDCAENLPRVAVEEVQLQEIFINLMKNAIQAIHGASVEGNVWATTSKKNGKVNITIKDDGPGIAEKVKNRLFDPFVTTKPPGQGTGLGLSICYGIAKRYDGEIRVDSELGKGTRFDIIFPAIVTEK